MKLVADPRNPAQYLGACGLFELAASHDQALTACWVDDGLLIEALSETAFKRLVDDFSQAELVLDDIWTGEDTIRPFVFSNSSAGIGIQMDWWEQRNGRSKSMWKCFAARQKASSLARQLLNDCRLGAAEATPANLFQLSQPQSGRFGFDPRSAWNAINAGFSPNDFDSKVPTYSFAELLAAVALQCWPYQSEHDRCRYHLWPRLVPLPLARLHAVTNTGPAFEFFRVKRGQGISCFTYSSPAGQSKENHS